jgi:putative ATP-binding cassette transporter
MAGIWPFGRGEIGLGEGRSLFVPQRPYLPLGTLTSALLFPLGARSRGNADPQIEENGFPAERLKWVLKEVGLDGLVGELNVVENWSQRLSLGEQQRLGFARILLAAPTLVFLDEATSGLDEPSEARLYSLLRSGSWRPTVISVGHRSTLLKLHDDVLDLTAFTGETSSETQPSIREKLEEGKSGEQLFFELALEDLTRAADLFRPIYDLTCGVSDIVSRCCF